MPNVQIRDVPEDIHRELIRRAEQSGQSLQQFLTGELARIASTPSLDDVLNRIERHATGNLSGRDAVAALAVERARR